MQSKLHARARQAALFWGALATVAVLGFVYLGYVRDELFNSFGLASWILPALAGLTLAGIWLSLRLKRDGLSFAMSSLTIVFSVVTVFLGLFPNVLPSTLGEAYTPDHPQRLQPALHAVSDDHRGRDFPAADYRVSSLELLRVQAPD